MRTRRMLLSALCLFAVCATSACGGGGPRSQTADLIAIHQPTPDPTLDAVVRDLPRALAGVAPTPTPTVRPAAPAVRQVQPAPTSKPTQKPAPPKPTPTASRH
jgi:hypothetical protein